MSEFWLLVEEVGYYLTTYTSLTELKPIGDYDYYQKLAKECEEKESRSCCSASVEAMEAGGYKLMPAEGCPEGYQGNGLKCIDSYGWCEPVVKEKIVGWQTYRNEEYGFEVKYPNNWNKINLGDFGLEIIPKYRRLPEEIKITIRAAKRNLELTLAQEATQSKASVNCEDKNIGTNRFCFVKTAFEGTRTDWYLLEKDGYKYYLQFLVNDGRQGMTYYIPDSELEHELNILH